ncbi:MAG TPA: hypothetical protein VIK25_08025 [Gemmatimonadaceae bacterium]
MPTISASLTTFPAAAIVAAGVLGALGARLHRRSSELTMLVQVRSSDAVRLLATEMALPLRDDNAGEADETGEPGEPDAKEAAVQLLDRWCERPRSAWRALGVRALQATRVEACARTASQVILEGILARHVPPMDAWLVRDFADTAWCAAPEDGERVSSAIELAARRAVTNGALALLAREWLPDEDFERLAMMVVH